MKNVRDAVIVAALASLFVTSAASATMMTYWGTGLGTPVITNDPNLFTNGESIFAGQRRLGFEGNFYWGYCVDLDHYSGNGDAHWQPLAELHNGMLIGYLMDTYGPGVDANLSAAALGVAIWEVLYETGPTFDAGSGIFSVSGDPNVIAGADQLLAGIPPSLEGYTPHSAVDRCDDAQAYVGLVPEPSTMALVALGAVGLLIRRRRSARRVS